MRAASLAAAPITMNSRRLGTPMFPYMTTPKCRPIPNSRVGSPRALLRSLSAFMRAMASLAASRGAMQANSVDLPSSSSPDVPA